MRFNEKNKNNKQAGAWSSGCKKWNKGSASVGLSNLLIAAFSNISCLKKRVTTEGYLVTVTHTAVCR